MMVVVVVVMVVVVVVVCINTDEEPVLSTSGDSVKQLTESMLSLPAECTVYCSVRL